MSLLSGTTHVGEDPVKPVPVQRYPATRLVPTPQWSQIGVEVSGVEGVFTSPVGPTGPPRGCQAPLVSGLRDVRSPTPGVSEGLSL